MHMYFSFVVLMLGNRWFLGDVPIVTLLAATCLMFLLLVLLGACSLFLMTWVEFHLEMVHFLNLWQLGLWLQHLLMRLLSSRGQ